MDEQTDYAFGVTDLAVQAVDPARVDDYLRLGEQAEGFAEAEAELARIRDTFPAVRYIYAYRILEDGCHVVLDPDLPDEPGSDPGDVIPFDNAFIVYRDTLLAGVPLNEGVISNESYGWLLTVYKPVYDDQGVCQCYVAADISMDHIIVDGYQFLVHVITLFCAFFILICTIILWLAKYGIVLPLNTLAHTNIFLEYTDDESRDKTVDMVRSHRLRERRRRAPVDVPPGSWPQSATVRKCRGLGVGPLPKTSPFAYMRAVCTHQPMFSREKRLKTSPFAYIPAKCTHPPMFSREKRLKTSAAAYIPAVCTQPPMFSSEKRL